MAVGSSARLLFCSMSLLLNLKEYRQLRSAREAIPLYCVFGDTVIKSIAEGRPRTKQELQAIRGFTEEKVNRYGDDILSLVSRAKPDPGPKPPLVKVRHARKVAPLHPCTRRRVMGKAFDMSKGALLSDALSMGKINTAPQRIPGIPAGKEGVYILELAQGRVYVGHSSDMRRRMQQHMAGQGSAFTKAFPPTGVILPRLGCVTGSAEAAERDETLRYMFLRGIQLVRGWRYVRVEMPEQEMEDAEGNIRELFDLCRRCGHPGHFITHCKANFDRLGRPCKP